MTITRTLLLPVLMALTVPMPAAAQEAYTPEPGSSERKQILDALRPSPDSSVRFVVRQLRVINAERARYAYAVVYPIEDQNDGGMFLLKHDDGWQRVWQALDGGVRECRLAAKHWRLALDMLEENGIDPDLLAPDLRESYEDLVNPYGEDRACYETSDQDEEALLAEAGTSSAPSRSPVIRLGQTITGVIESDDKVMVGNILYDSFEFIAQAGQTITISARSNDFDTFLEISDFWGFSQVNDNSTGISTDSDLTVTLPEDGCYTIMVSTSHPDALGKYTLEITGRPGDPAAADQSGPQQFYCDVAPPSAAPIESASPASRDAPIPEP
ncbi:MAG: hypothetical protein EDM03_08650 [Porphyrobacter sp. IPPAS B-1204]|nr:MAG: hypothetical protein EDM03_08650 [Porphyrobacter sp. IPPAS B-1204]